MKRMMFGVAMLCAGCSSGNVALGFQVSSSSSQALTSAEQSPEGTAAPILPAGLTLERARLLLNEVELHQKGIGRGRPVRGPYVLSLSGDDLVAASTKTVADVTVPAGTYSDLELEIEPYDNEEGAEATASSASSEELAEFAFQGASAFIEGSYNGAPFKIVGKFTADMVTTAPLVVTDGTAVAVAITFDPRSWFRDDAGAVIDPTVAANSDVIATRICLSLEPGKTGAASSHCLGGGEKGPRGGGPGKGGKHGR